VNIGMVPAKPGESPEKKRPKIDEKSPKRRAEINQNRVRDAAGDRKKQGHRKNTKKVAQEA
jgi:hypothetical protein